MWVGWIWPETTEVKAHRDAKSAPAARANEEFFMISISAPQYSEKVATISAPGATSCVEMP
jgi:hypothetical protein